MNSKQKLAELKYQDSRLRKLKAEFHGKLSKNNQPKYPGFTFKETK